MVRVRKFDEVQFIGVYLGPSHSFDEKKPRYKGRFASNTGIIHDVDLENRMVWGVEVISEKG